MPPRKKAGRDPAPAAVDPSVALPRPGRARVSDSGGVAEAQANGARARSKSGSARSPKGRSRSASRRRAAHADIPPVNDAPDGSIAAAGCSKAALEGNDSSPAIPAAERWNMALLVLLYAMQGIPLGLTQGALPFMLQERLSYSQMGIFALAAYPYSFKLFWSPIVDALYLPSFGRRKSWIVPVQLLMGCLLIVSGGTMQSLMDAGDVASLTALFFVFVLLAATQDIAVDGWALTLLSERNVGYASTCQTLGMNFGYFTSFTVFLALNDANFCNTYVRPSRAYAALFGNPWGAANSAGGAAALPAVGILTLAGFLRFWGWFFLVATAAVAAMKPEAPEPQDAPQTTVGGKAASPRPSAGAAVRAAYEQLWHVARLPAIWRLSALLLTYRLGVMVAENAAALKLVDKGVSKESLAFLVLLQFPLEMVSALVSGGWARVASPAAPFAAGYAVRLATAVALTALVNAFPPTGATLQSHPGHFALLAAIGCVSSMASTLTFTSLGALFNTVSDPSMGGAYLTLLNTIANMGSTLPKTPLYFLMDRLTCVACLPPASAGGAIAAGATAAAAHLSSLSCPLKPAAAAGPNACTAAGGLCALQRDGFYVLAYGMAVAGVGLGVWYVWLLPSLIALPLSRWRVAAAQSDKRS